MEIEEQSTNTTGKQMGNDSRTPIKQRLRRSSTISQTERKVIKAKNRRPSTSGVFLNSITASPIIENIKRGSLLARNVSPSQCFVRLPRLRLSKLGKNVSLSSSPSGTECDTSIPSVDVQSRKCVIHPRFLYKSPDCDDNIDTNGELEDTLNRTFTLRLDDDNLTDVKEKSEEASDQTNSQDSPSKLNRRRTYDITENSVYNGLQENTDFGCDTNVETSTINFNNVTLRKKGAEEITFNIENSSTNTESFASAISNQDVDFILTNRNFDLKEELKQQSSTKNRSTFKKPKRELGKSANTPKKLPKITQRSPLLGTPSDEVTPSLFIVETSPPSGSDAKKVTSNRIDDSNNDRESFASAVSHQDIDFGVTNRNIDLQEKLKEQSLTKKLSSFKKPKNELEKLANTSKNISRRNTQRPPLLRIPKISGSQALQLYEFLSGETQENNTITHDTEKPSGEITKNSFTVENSLPSASSTPNIIKKHVVHTLLKCTSKRKGSSDAVLTSGSDATTNVKKKVTLSKMPNFAMLHKKHFDKMENISDYKERKNERAKLLLSGGKPNNATVPRPVSKKIVKTLLIEPCSQSTSTKGDEIKKGKSADSKSILTAEPYSKSTSINGEVKKVKTCDSKSTLTTEPNNKSTSIKVKPCDSKSTSIMEPNNKSTSMKVKACDSKSTLIMQPNNKNTSIKVKPCDSKSTLTVEPYSKSTSIKGAEVKKVKLYESKSTVEGHKVGYTRFGFRVPVKMTKDDAVKAISNKIRMPKNSPQQQKRAIIKGVRSNRRFDLLMKMRNNK